MRFLCCVLVVVCLLFPAKGEERMYMRVVARDNGPFAQAEKYMIRDAALCLGPNGMEKLSRWYPGLEVEYRSWQPDEKTPPAQTVYITIGRGEGKNWWGVFYPQSAGWAAGPGEEGLIFPFFSWLMGLFTGR